MKTFKNVCLILLMTYFSAYSNGYVPAWSSSGLQPQLKQRQMHAGEEITYIVKYSLLKLGEVKLQVLEQKERNGKIYYRTKAFINSYRGVPFVDLHQIYESNFNIEGYSDFFRATEKENDYIKFTEYFFDYRKMNVRIKKGKYKPDEVWTDSTAGLKTFQQDGLSLFYYARLNSGTKKSVDVPCFVTEEFVSTKINFYNKPEMVKIEAVDHEIPCMRLDGHTDFVSIFGLTGNFEGFFTNDEYAVPTIARMKVIIGNVSLELKDWRIENWRPPK